METNLVNRPTTGAACSADSAYTWYLSVGNSGADGSVRITYKDGDTVNFPIAAGQTLQLAQAGGTERAPFSA
jgi:hypothetical protein